MREIKFRGKSLFFGNWVYGYYFKSDAYNAGSKNTKKDLIMKDGTFILEENHSSASAVPVIMETVGQYTGLKDNNGKEIYEGDIVHYWGGEYCQGFYENNRTITIDNLSYNIVELSKLGENIEVIGNIYDTKEEKE